MANWKAQLPQKESVARSLDFSMGSAAMLSAAASEDASAAASTDGLHPMEH